MKQVRKEVSCSSLWQQTFDSKKFSRKSVVSFRKLNYLDEDEIAQSETKLWVRRLYLAKSF